MKSPYNDERYTIYKNSIVLDTVATEQTIVTYPLNDYNSLYNSYISLHNVTVDTTLRVYADYDGSLREIYGTELVWTTNDGPLVSMSKIDYDSTIVITSQFSTIISSSVQVDYKLFIGEK